MYNGYVTRVKNIRPAENADRLNLCDVFGNTVVVDKNINENDLYVYFPCDGQLSLDFCLNNNLLRKLPDGTPGTGYMDPDKRNVVAIKLRGNKSDGLILPINCLAYTGINLNTLTEGTIVNTINGHEICCKYIPRGKNRIEHNPKGNKTRNHKEPIAPLFMEHVDTEQLNYNLNAFKPGDLVEITLKMHGTSQRTGYVPTLKGYKRSLWDIIARHAGKPIYDWDYVTGTRRTVLDTYDGGYYGSNEFREQHSKFFEGKLHKGETVYYEVVGFTHTGAPIMGDADNKKLNDKAFIKQYGPITRFSYGCSPDGIKMLYGQDEDGTFALEAKKPQSDFYVYRMTMTNEDGDVVEYTPDFMRYRCEQMGAKCVPVFWKGFIPDRTEHIVGYDANGEIVTATECSAGEWIKDVAEQFYDGPDPVGKTHVREGVVVRIVNRPSFTAYKTKNFSFKVLEGICKATSEAPDMEEAQEI